MNHKENFKFDIVIVGAGIIGLSIAYRLINKKNLSILLIDSESMLGHHSSGRNSGVLHAGLYYENNSLKHKLCIEGQFLWFDIADLLDIPVRKCGKFIIAKNESEISAFEYYLKRAQDNNVQDLRMMTVEEKNLISQFVNVKEGFFSPNTSIIDASDAINKLANEIESKDGIILKSKKIISVVKDKNFKVELDDCIVEADYFINAAGLGGVKIREQLGLVDLENFYVKGNYLKLNQKYFTEHLIYPVPEKNLLGLGVHTSFGLDNIVRFGPNTEEVTELDYNEGISIEDLKRAVLSSFKKIEPEKLSYDFSGIRPKLKKDGVVVSDFWIEKNDLIKNYIELLGIESPGFTSAPAIANLVFNLI